jgi:hypothetical protein
MHPTAAVSGRTADAGDATSLGVRHNNMAKARLSTAVAINTFVALAIAISAGTVFLLAQNVGVPVAFGGDKGVVLLPLFVMPLGGIVVPWFCARSTPALRRAAGALLGFMLGTCAIVVTVIGMDALGAWLMLIAPPSVGYLGLAGFGLAQKLRKIGSEQTGRRRSTGA